MKIINEELNLVVRRNKKSGLQLIKCYVFFKPVDGEEKISFVCPLCYFYTKGCNYNIYNPLCCRVDRKSSLFFKRKFG